MLGLILTWLYVPVILSRHSLQKHGQAAHPCSGKKRVYSTGETLSFSNIHNLIFFLYGQALLPH